MIISGNVDYYLQYFRSTELKIISDWECLFYFRQKSAKRFKSATYSKLMYITEELVSKHDNKVVIMDSLAKQREELSFEQSSRRTNT